MEIIKGDTITYKSSENCINYRYLCLRIKNIYSTRYITVGKPLDFGHDMYTARL